MPHTCMSFRLYRTQQLCIHVMLWLGTGCRDSSICKRHWPLPSRVSGSATLSFHLAIANAMCHGNAMESDLMYPGLATSCVADLVVGLLALHALLSLPLPLLCILPPALFILLPATHRRWRQDRLKQTSALPGPAWLCAEAAFTCASSPQHSQETGMNIWSHLRQACQNTRWRRDSSSHSIDKVRCRECMLCLHSHKQAAVEA